MVGSRKRTGPTEILSTGGRGSGRLGRAVENIHLHDLRDR